MKEKLKYVSQNIKSFRVRLGYKQEDVAKMLGVVRETYCDYETNPGQVKVETLTRLSEILNCSLSDFFVETIVTKSDI